MSAARAAVVSAALLLAACGGGGDDAARDELDLSLGFLETDFAMTEAQVACVADEVEDGAGDVDLDALAASIRSVDAGEVTLDELPEAQGRVLRTAIAMCAASG